MIQLHNNKRIWWLYLLPKRLTLSTNPAVYRWLFWVQLVSHAKKKQSLVGYMRKNWNMKMCRAQARIPTLFPTKKVYYDMAYVEAVKVRITIEEL